METPSDLRSVKLTKLQSSHNNLRTSSIEGWCFDLPQVGSSFAMMAPPLAEGNVRMINTTQVKSMSSTDDGSIQFETENSLYVLTILSESKQA
jgi:hypothetical protein